VEVFCLAPEERDLDPRWLGEWVGGVQAVCFTVMASVACTAVSPCASISISAWGSNSRHSSVVSLRSCRAVSSSCFLGNRLQCKWYLGLLQLSTFFFFLGGSFVRVFLFLPLSLFALYWVVIRLKICQGAWEWVQKESGVRVQSSLVGNMSRMHHGNPWTWGSQSFCFRGWKFLLTVAMGGQWNQVWIGQKSGRGFCNLLSQC